MKDWTEDIENPKREKSMAETEKPLTKWFPISPIVNLRKKSAGEEIQRWGC
jgi:hypothetical protein